MTFDMSTLAMVGIWLLLFVAGYLFGKRSKGVLSEDAKVALKKHELEQYMNMYKYQLERKNQNDD